MKKSKKIKDVQRYHDKFTLGMIAFLFILGIVKIPHIIEASSTQYKLMYALSMFVVLTAGALLLYCKLSVKITKNYVKLGIAPFPWMRRKIPLEDIESVTPFETNGLEGSSRFLHFGHTMNVYAFGDSNGVLLHMQDGSQIVIHSDMLYEHVSQLEQRLSA